MRIFKSQEDLKQERMNKHVLARTTYPIHKKLIILGRQSTAKQVIQNRESYEQQTEELLEKALDLGWSQEDITILYENNYDKYGQKSEKPRDVSGNLSIDERPILKLIVDTIKGGGVGAVMFYDVSRLTRDIDVVDGPYFASVCRERNVIILTNDDEFDFNRREDDINKFVVLCVESKNYRQNHIMKKVNPARERVARRGEFFGHSIPVGLMLDAERKFYVPNPHWQEQVASLFKRFRELDANFALWYREIYGKMLFPTLPPEIAARVGTIHMTPVQGGYTIKARSSLQAFLTNTAYIGHLLHQGQLIRDTHPAIVDEEDFWYAFNHISPTDIEGNPIEREKRVVRYQQDTDVERPHALLEGVRSNGKPVITSPERNVYVVNYANNESRYRARNLKAFELDEIAIKVPVVDALVEQRLMAHLALEIAFEETNAVLTELAIAHGEIPEETPDGVSMVDSFRAVDTQEPTRPTTPDSRIEEIECNIARLDREYKLTFDIMSDTDIRENRASKARLMKRLDDVKKSQENTVQEQQDSQEAVDLVASGTLQEKWLKWKMEKKQKFIRLATQDIILERVADNWLTLTIKWRSWIQKEAPHRNILLVDTAYIFHSSTTWQAAWTPDEDDIIRALYPDASRSEILQCLPRRSWWSIRIHASNLKVLRQTRTNGSELPFDVSVDDVTFLQKHNLVLDNSDKRVWWTCELCNLDSQS